MSTEPAAFDADNHYYEAFDAFTRHIEPAMANRAVRWAEVGGKKRLLVGGRLDRFIPNPTFDPVSKPGSLDEYFRGRNPEGTTSARALWGELEPIRPEYRDRDVRLRVMDRQGLGGCFLFPTQGMGIEEALCNDPPAVVAAFRAFNRWIEEDWGFAYRERLFAAPVLTLVDPDAAAREVEHLLERGARILCLRCGPVRTPALSRSPADRIFDPVWARIQEAGATVAFHAGDAGYQRYNEWESSDANFLSSPFTSMVFHDRPVFDTFAALLSQGFFARFPALRVASIENGSEWVPVLLKKIEVAFGRLPRAFHEDPVETFRRQVWVAPFYEDELDVLKQLMPVDHILFGSDWPHAEGLAEPRSFADDLRRFGYLEPEITTILCESARALIRSQPHGAA